MPPSKGTKAGAAAQPLGAITPPSGAVTWSCWAVTATPKKREEDGKSFTSHKRKRCVGEALADGTLPQLWTVAEFAPSTVLGWWGPGKYLVEWWDKRGEKISHVIFQVDTPPGVTAAAAAAQQATPVAASSSALMPAGMPQTPFEWMMYTQQREEAAAERRRLEQREDDARRREDYERQAQRDRDFLGMIVTTMGGKGGGGTVDAELLRREMALTIRESVASLRSDVGRALEQIRDETGGGDDGDDDHDDPKNVGDAAEGILLSMLGTLQQRAPELMGEAVPALIALMQRKGVKLSPEAERRVRGMTNGTAS